MTKLKHDSTSNHGLHCALTIDISSSSACVRKLIIAMEEQAAYRPPSAKPTRIVMLCCVCQPTKTVLVQRIEVREKVAKIIHNNISVIVGFHVPTDARTIK